MDGLTRLRRLVAEEIEGCTDADVESRIESLDDLADSVPAPPPADLAAMEALGDDTRHRIVRLLVAADRELCVCEFAPLLSVGESAISHALSDLTDAGLVARRKEGQWRYYRPTERAERLLRALEETQGDGA